MKIYITNKQHPLWNFTYDVLYIDGDEYVIMVRNRTVRIDKEDCEIV